MVLYTRHVQVETYITVLFSEYKLTPAWTEPLLPEPIPIILPEVVLITEHKSRTCAVCFCQTNLSARPILKQSNKQYLTNGDNQDEINTGCISVAELTSRKKRLNWHICQINL